MGVRTVNLLLALRDRGLTVSELVDRIGANDLEMLRTLRFLEDAGLVFKAQQAWHLATGARELLAVHDRNSNSQMSAQLDWMMRSNRGLVPIPS